MAGDQLATVPAMHNPLMGNYELSCLLGMFHDTLSFVLCPPPCPSSPPFRLKSSRSREGTPSRHSESDNLSVDSGDLLGHGHHSTPPGSPAAQRRRRYPALALSPAQRAQQESGVPGGLMCTHVGDAGDSSFFSEKIYRSSQEKTYINGL